jgi:hypothetical protein
VLLEATNDIVRTLKEGDYMFWQSVFGGLGVLAHWQVWVALVIYAALQVAWLIGIGMMMGNSDSGGRMLTGCLNHIFQISQPTP